MLTSRGLGVVLGDLASMGFNAAWGVLGASDVGANHERQRIWIVGEIPNSNNSRFRSSFQYFNQQEQQTKTNIRGNGEIQSVAYANSTQCERSSISVGIQQKNAYACDSRWWETEPNVGRVADGVAARVDRLKAIGNGQVPLCAAEAWKILSNTVINAR